MAQFMLMYTNGPGPRPPELTPEAMQDVVAQYVAWTEKVAADGRLVASHRLSDVHSDPGRVCRIEGDELLVSDGPLAETKEVVGGYAIIDAADYDEAVSLCRDHPAARSGKVVIRQLF